MATKKKTTNYLNTILFSFVIGVLLLGLLVITSLMTRQRKMTEGNASAMGQVVPPSDPVPAPDVIDLNPPPVGDVKTIAPPPMERMSGMSELQ